jgi:hypothetical protein
MKKKVYLAGPAEMAGRCRWGLVEETYFDRSGPGIAGGGARELIAALAKPERRPFQANGEDFLYVGPFFTSCDHGCSHGNPHAVFSTCGGMPDNAGELQSILSAVVARDIAAIKDANEIFAWIPREGCHGTIAEVGFAAAFRKALHVGFANQALQDSHWFMARMATSYGIYSSPLEFFSAASQEGDVFGYYSEEEPSAPAVFAHYAKNLA